MKQINLKISKLLEKQQEIVLKLGEAKEERSKLSPHFKKIFKAILSCSWKGKDLVDFQAWLKETRKQYFQHLKSADVATSGNEKELYYTYDDFKIHVTLTLGDYDLVEIRCNGKEIVMENNDYTKWQTHYVLAFAFCKLGMNETCACDLNSHSKFM
jgi:hypothetical protein